MCEGLMLRIGEDGIAREYNPEYDLVIHCESAEELEEMKKLVINALKEKEIVIYE